MQKTRFLAMLLSIVLILGAIPMMSLTASAEEVSTSDQENAETESDTATGLQRRKEDGVYLIQSTEDWAKFAKHAMGHTCAGMSFELTADLDFSKDQTKFASTATGDFSETNQVYAMIGFNTTFEFGGMFDGKGHTISGLTITSSSDIGLFRYVAGATIKNVRLSTSKFTTTGDGKYVGGIVSRVRGTAATVDTSRETIIENCIVEEDVVLKDGKKDGTCTRIGGIVADATCAANLNYNKLTIKNCIAKATLNISQGIGNSGNTYLGGILGDANSHAAGYHIDLVIDNCVSTVSIDCKVLNPSVKNNISVGGIVGELVVNQGAISNCYSNIAVNMDWTATATDATKTTAFTRPAIGGIVGAVNRTRDSKWTLGTTASTKISNCIAVSNLNSDLAESRGDALAIFKVGGIAGYAGDAVEDTAMNNTVIENVFWKSNKATSDFQKKSDVSYAETGASGELPEAPKVTETGFSISLNGDIGVNVYLSKMTNSFSASGKSVSMIPQAKIVTPKGQVEGFAATVSDEKGYKFTGNVAAKEMEEQVQFEIYFAVSVGDGTAVRIPTGATFAHSVMDYLTSENVKNSDDEKLKTLCAEMKFYGEYAEAYFDGKKLTDYPKVTEADFANVADMSVSGTDENVTFRGISLVLETKTALRVYFTLKEGSSMVAVAVNNQEATPIDKGNGLYYAEVVLDAKDLQTENIFTLGDLTVSASAVSYCKSAVKTGNASALTDLVKALYAYSNAAKNYFFG